MSQHGSPSKNQQPKGRPLWGWQSPWLRGKGSKKCRWQGVIGVLGGVIDADQPGQIWAAVGEWQLIFPHPGEPLGRLPKNLQLLVILLHAGDKSLTSLVLGWDGWWSWDVVTLCSELGLAQSP